MTTEQPITGEEKTPSRTLWIPILLGLVLGILTGFALSPKGGGMLTEIQAPVVADWLALPGYIFLALIQMVIIPLIVSSIILGIAASENKAFLKRAGLRIAPYFVATTCVAIFIGIAMATTLRPGDYVDVRMMESVDREMLESDLMAMSDARPEQSIPQMITDLIPSNPDQAVSERAMFQIVVYAIFIAAGMLALGHARIRPLLELLDIIQDTMMQIVSWAMWLAPLAVFGLLAKAIIIVGIDAIMSVGLYVVAVLLGLALLLAMYLSIVAFVARRNPLAFLKQIAEVQLLAFSTSSSAAVMPLSMRVAEEKMKVKPDVAQFIIPLGATVNMDGTALYQAAAAVFLTQVYGIDLSLMSMALLAATTVGASIGTPSTPGVGIVVLVTILHTIGVPPEGVAMIIGVDRFLDMCRTAVNVSGDLTACAVMDRWLGDEGDGASRPDGSI